MALIVGGAAGNLIDRIRFGYVEDMFDFRAINFAIFNVADCCVVVGTILLAAPDPHLRSPAGQAPWGGLRYRRCGSAGGAS